MRLAAVSLHANGPLIVNKTVSVRFIRTVRMFRQAASSSHSPRALSGDLSPNQSSCSSDTGDVLIRSTRILSDRRREAGPGPGSVQITVQKLRDPAPFQPPPAEQHRRPKAGQTPDTGAPPRSAAGGQPDRLSGQTKENREPTGRPNRKLSAGTQRDRQPGHDLLTSRFTAGGRGVVLAALKQRFHSAPHRREVRVKLLDPGPLQNSSQDPPGLRSNSQDAAGVAGVQVEAGLSSGCLGDATNAAAAAAAAVAAPLIKMEAQVSQLVDGVQRLLQADREGRDRGRSQSQQTLQQLETLHGRQLQLQSQLLESALRIVTGHTPAPSLTSDLTASGQTAHLQVTHLDCAADVLRNQQQSSTATTAAVLETGPVTMATPSCDRQPEKTRGDRHRRGAPSVSTATHQPKGSHLQSSDRHSRAAARKANEVLREMGRLKTEMKALLTPEDCLTTTRPPPDHHQSQQSQSQQHQVQQIHSQSQQSQSVLVQRRPVVPSTLEEAGQVLRQVRRQKKVLEENLEALLRAKTGEVLHCQLEALAANRDWTEEVRIKKTVDAWISTLSKDFQAETSSEDAAVTSQLRAVQSERGRPVSTLRGTGSKTTAGRGGRGQRARHGAVQGAEPGRGPGALTDSEQVEGESYLTHLYGRAPYEGLRRTLKKSPYLRFSSPVSPLSRKPRPRLVESVRGVKVKSCKTQTSLAPPLSPSPGRPHHLLSSSHMNSGDPADITVTPADTYSVPMAIPLGRRRMDSSSRCLAERQQEVTSPPTPVSRTSSEAAAVVDRAPERQREEQVDAGEAPPPPSHMVIEVKSEEDEGEENVFPGADFLSVANVIQEEVSVGGEEAVELDGGPSPPPVLYQGPVFPPQGRSALPAQSQTSVLDADQQRDALENRLVEWVEQQLMSRMISEIYRPPPSDPAQNVSSDQSELEDRSVTSDIVEAAGGGGLQLFVDSNVSVDSALIRQLVNEVLTETVALMLGQRDALDTGPGPGLEPPKAGAAAHEEAKLVPLVPTPEPTPPPSPTPPAGHTTPLATPPPPEPTSLLNEESPQPITAPEPVATPTPSPEPAPSAGSPPVLHQAPPPLPWGDAELPLAEERPEEHVDTQQLLLMSVAEEEPPLSSPLPPPRSPSPSPRPDPEPRPASPSSSSSFSESSSSSSVTPETEAALKHISEGELLITVNQLAAMTEEVVCSFSSSLQELQDMDYDPPSEGQVRGHNLLLSMLTKMEQGVAQRGERPQPEGSWGREDQDQGEEVSVGEVTDDRTTNLLRTTDPRSSSRRTEAGRGQTSSPGQISQCAEVSFEATNQGSDTVGDLMAEPLGTLTSDLQTDLSLSPPPRHPAAQVVDVLIRKLHTLTAAEEEEEGGARRMDVHLPSIRAEEELMEELMEVSAAADTDSSSTNDVF